MSVGTVIKAGDAGPILRHVTTVDLADHLAEARAVVDEAKRRAATIVRRAERQRKEVLEEARRSGHQVGHAEGIGEGKAAGYEAAHREALERFDRAHGALVSDMKRAIAEIDATKEDLRIEAERDLLDFALLVARKLTFSIGRVHRESAAANLGHALSLVSSKTDLTARVHSDDLESMKTFAEEVLEAATASRAIKFVVDDSLAPGGCVVETARMAVDASLETQVDEMVSLLLGETGGA